MHIVKVELWVGGAYLRDFESVAAARIWADENVVVPWETWAQVRPNALKVHKSKYDDLGVDTVNAIIEDYEKGWNYRQLSEKYGIPEGTFNHLLRRWAKIA